MSQKRVLFFAPFGSFGVHHQLDAVLAHALRQRGQEVLIIGCDGIYKDCDVTARDRDHSEENCASCAQAGNTCYTPFNLPRVQLRNYLSQNDIEEATMWVDSLNPEIYTKATYEGFPLGEWVMSSVMTFFWIPCSHLSGLEVSPVYRQYLINGVLTLRACRRIIDEFQPTNFCAFNGRFAPYRIAFELARVLGISSFTHERGFIDNSFTLYDNNNANENGAVHRTQEAWKNIPLMFDELEKTTRYLKEREVGKNLNFPAFVNYSSSYTSVRHRLGIPHDAKVIGLFTSSEIEAVNSQEVDILGSQEAIIRKLFEVFKDRKEYLIIRHHPLMAGKNDIPTDYVNISRILGYIHDAPPNVRIIMPSEEITSYSIIETIDACIAFFSTVATETLVRNIPTATLTESRFHSVASTHWGYKEIDKIELIIDQLLACAKQVSSETLIHPYRFLHTYIDKVSRQFTSFGIENNYGAKILVSISDKIEKGRDPELDTVCDYVMYGTPLHPVPTSEHQSRIRSDEASFFAAKDAELKANRTILAKEWQEYSQTHLHPSSTVLHKGSRSKKLNFRYPDVNYKEIFTDYSVDSIYEIINNTNSEYFLFSSPYMVYDPALILDATYRLTEKANAHFNGVFYASWLATESGDLFSSLFRTSQGLNETPNPYNSHGWVCEALGILGSMILDRTTLKNALEATRIKNSLPSLEDLVTNILELNILKSGCPLLQALPQIPQKTKVTSSTPQLGNNLFLHQALALLKTYSYDECYSLLDKIQMQGRYDRDLYYMISLCQVGLKQLPQARVSLLRELAHYPDNTQAQELLIDVVIELLSPK